MMRLSCGNTHRVLIAGGDKCQLNELRENLTFSPIECESVVNLKTAKQVLKCRTMDVLVIDSMAILDHQDQKEAEELLKGLKADFSDTQIVIYNGVRNRSLQRRLRRSGADGYLSDKNNMKNVAGSVLRLLRGADSVSV